VAHEECAGRGSVTTWVEGVIGWKPETRPLTWPVPGVSLLVAAKARTRGDWRHTRLDGYGHSLDELGAEAAKGLGPDLAKAEKEVARTVTLKSLPLARVDVTGLPHRVCYAHPVPAAPPGGTAYGAFSVPSPHRTVQIAAAAMGALAFLVLVWWFLL
jgi:hypothetical protein